MGDMGVQGLLWSLSQRTEDMIVQGYFCNLVW